MCWPLYKKNSAYVQPSGIQLTALNLTLILATQSIFAHIRQITRMNSYISVALLTLQLSSPLHLHVTYLWNRCFRSRVCRKRPFVESTWIIQVFSQVHLTSTSLYTYLCIYCTLFTLTFYNKKYMLFRQVLRRRPQINYWIYNEILLYQATFRRFLLNCWIILPTLNTLHFVKIGH